MCTWLALIALGSAAPKVRLDPRQTFYEVVVVAGIGDQRIVSEDRLVVGRGRRERTVTTLHSRSEWHDGVEHTLFVSDTPAAATPWPLITQFAVASVPVTVRFDAGGLPVALVAPEQWAADAQHALDALELPSQAKRSTEALIDPTSFLSTLQRIFVGASASQWRRVDHLSGIDIVRDEHCDSERDGAQLIVTCSGVAIAQDDSDSQLRDTQTHTTLRYDRRGLLSVEDSWSATLVHLSRDGQSVRDSPVGGRRLLVRR